MQSLAQQVEQDTKQVIDPFGRHIHYVRLSVTDRCNLRCVYCMSEEMTFLPRKDILTLEEIYEVGKAFTELGFNKIRLTGGEPLVRSGVNHLISQLGRLDGLEDFTLTTNGALLEKYIDDIKDSGIKRINISLDTLDKKQYKTLARVDKLDDTLKGIQIALKAGLKVKLNCVVLKGINTDAIDSLTAYAVEHDCDISFIEEMPLGKIDSHQRAETVVFSEQIIQQLSKNYSLVEDNYKSGGPANYYQLAGTNSRVGFISPHSNNFCGSCNRVRVTVEGQLLLCLGNEHAVDLRAVLRSENYSSEKLQETILNAIQNDKPEKHYFDVNETKILRFMNMTGG